MKYDRAAPCAARHRRHSEPTAKQQVVDVCIEALGPYYAGTKTSGGSTIALGYYGQKPVPALRVTCKPSPNGEAEGVSTRGGGAEVHAGQSASRRRS